MAQRHIVTALGILAVSAVNCFAAPGSTIGPKSPAVVPERGLELPFELKTESAMKFHGPDANNAPAILSPTTQEHRPFFGLGLSRPIETGK